MFRDGQHNNGYPSLYRSVLTADFPVLLKKRGYCLFLLIGVLLVLSLVVTFAATPTSFTKEY